MTFTLPVLLILAACWLLPAAVVALAFRFAATSSAASSGPTTMTTTVKGLRADVRRLDLDARDEGWRRENWRGPAASVRARIADTSHEVMLLTPYAEASVPVGIEGEEGERRRCSVCLN